MAANDGRKTGKTKGAAGRAGKSAKRSTGKRRTAARKTADPGKKLIDTAMSLAAERGWSELSLSEIAAAAGLNLSEVHPRFPSKQAILDELSRRIDGQVLAEVSPDDFTEEESARDRLFDVLMQRFDALSPYREAIGEILYDKARHPLSSVAAMPQLLHSMSWMLEAAGIPATGARGLLRTKGLVPIYLMTLRTWVRDDSRDMAKTMAALDGYLRRVEPLARAIDRTARRTRA